MFNLKIEDSALRCACSEQLGKTFEEHICNAADQLAGGLAGYFELTQTCPRAACIVMVKILANFMSNFEEAERAKVEQHLVMFLETELGRRKCQTTQ
jgi:hypothetical protein